MHADDPVFLRFMFDRFDYAIRCYGGDAQPVAQIPNRLVMRRVDLDIVVAVTLRKAGYGCELGNFTAGLDPSGVDGVGRIGGEAFFAVLNAGVQFAGNVLVESAAEADVEALAAITDGQDGFARSKGVFEDGKIGFFPVFVGVMGLCVARCAVERGIHVGGGAG